MKKISICLFIFFTIFSFYAQVAETPEDVKPIEINEPFPNVNLTTLAKEISSTTQIINNKPTIFLFYRGGWCPYCNKHLAAVGESIDEIKALGYQVIGVSPDAPENLSKSIDKNNLSYSLYSDGYGTLIKALGIAFKAPEKYESMLSKYSDDKNNELLPVPSLFVVDKNGIILYKYVNADYKERLSPENLIKVLNEIN